MKLARSAVLALLTLAACKDVLTQTPDYRPEDAGTVDHAMCLLGFTAIPLRELATGHHVVDAVLNGRSATFVVDTGANATVLHTPLAKDFGLSPRSGGLIGGIGVGIGGATRAGLASIESLTIGDIAIRRNRIMTTDLGQVTRLLSPLAGTTVSGIIGQDVMKEHRAVIDVARPILYLISADKDPAPVPGERCRTGRVERRSLLERRE